jgi:hypothetical protein
MTPRSLTTWRHGGINNPDPGKSVFLRSEWFKTLAGTILDPADQLEVIVVYDGSDPVATLPMYRSGRKLRSLTELSTESFDLIHGGDLRPVERLISHLDRQIRGVGRWFSSDPDGESAPPLAGRQSDASRHSRPNSGA